MSNYQAILRETYFDFNEKMTIKSKKEIMISRQLELLHKFKDICFYQIEYIYFD